MTNDDIVNIICNLKKLNIVNFSPINEWGKITDQDFDKNFILNRIYENKIFNFKKRIRFVIYPNRNYVTVFITNVFVSNIIKTKEGKKIYFNERSEKISLIDINKEYNIIMRTKKINKIIFK